MDFIGFGPIEDPETTIPQSTPDLVQTFFFQQDGLTRYLHPNQKYINLKGYIIEVKSRSTQNHWKPFTYSFSPNQEDMFAKAMKYRFKVVICGITLANDWEISMVLTNPQGKVLSQDFFNSDQ